MLEYDDSAFYYFSLAVLTFILIPYTYFQLKTLLFGNVAIDSEGVNCETEWFQNLVKTKTQQQKKSIWTRAFIFRIIVGSFFWYLWVMNYKLVSSIEGL